MAPPALGRLLARGGRRGISTTQLDHSRNDRQRVVILGSGWAGYTLARTLDPRQFQTVVVSPRSYFTFTPLLASTSVGTLEFRTAMESVRKRGTDTAFFQGWADRVDFRSKRLMVEEAVENPLQSHALDSAHTTKGGVFELPYDKLVIGVGCYAQTFNTPGVKEHAYFLKDVGDARRIRNRLLSCFELAALPTTPLEKQKQLLNFAVVGGGPTGIEWSAELHDIVKEDLARIYPDLVQHVRITVYDVSSKILRMFDEKLSNYAINTFAREGIDIKTSHHVKSLRLGSPMDEHDTTVYTLDLQEEGEIGCGLVVWSTGLMANPFIDNLDVEKHERTGSIVTDDRLRVGPSAQDVFALGDCAVIRDNLFPATAQVANQKALWLGRRLNKGDVDTAVRGFTYKDLGVMAYIGNWNAVLQIPGAGEISGRVAWFIWRGAYLAKSVSWRNRVLIPIFWLINWLFGRDISRF